LSKRKLLQLVQDENRQWMGRSPHADVSLGSAGEAILRKRFATSATRLALPKANSVIDIALLEHFVRQDLNRRAPRVMGVLRPLKVVIVNYPEGQVEEMEAINNPEDPSAGTQESTLLAGSLHRAG
jgi:glutaminyl-tRNA synthetase